MTNQNQPVPATVTTDAVDRWWENTEHRQDPSEPRECCCGLSWPCPIDILTRERDAYAAAALHSFVMRGDGFPERFPGVDAKLDFLLQWGLGELRDNRDKYAETKLAQPDDATRPFAALRTSVPTGVRR